MSSRTFSIRPGRRRGPGSLRFRNFAASTPGGACPCLEGWIPKSPPPFRRLLAGSLPELYARRKAVVASTLRPWGCVSSISRHACTRLNLARPISSERFGITGVAGIVATVPPGGVPACKIAGAGDFSPPFGNSGQGGLCCAALAAVQDFARLMFGTSMTFPASSF